MSRLCSDYPTLSLSCTPGLLPWKTFRVLWTFRGSVTFRSKAPDMNAFFQILHSNLAHWLEMLDLSVSHEAVSLYMHAIERWLLGRDVPVRSRSATDMLKRLVPPGVGGGG